MPKQKEEIAKYIEELAQILTIVAKDKKLLQVFLKDLLTPAEMEELGLRWQIVKKLSGGASQRAVVQDLKVAVATVTRGARMLLNPDGGFNQVLRNRRS